MDFSGTLNVSELHLVLWNSLNEQFSAKLLFVEMSLLFVSSWQL